MASFSVAVDGHQMQVGLKGGSDTASGEEVLAAQARTYLHWINLTLKRKSIKVSDLYEDLESGVVLIRLMECLAPGKNMHGRYVCIS